MTCVNHKAKNGKRKRVHANSDNCVLDVEKNMSVKVCFDFFFKWGSSTSGNKVAEVVTVKSNLGIQGVEFRNANDVVEMSRLLWL